MHEPLTDGQSQTRSSVFTDNRVVSLREGLEYARLLFRCDADTRIGHAEAYFVNGIVRFNEIEGNRHTPMIRELDRISDQIGKSLA